MKPVLWMVATLAVLAIALPTADAQAPGSTIVNPGQRSVGATVGVGVNGVQAGVMLGHGDVGVRLTGGYYPLLLWYVGGFLAEESKLEYFSTYHFQGHVRWLPISAGPRGKMGAAAGYEFNSVLGSGGHFALEAQINLRPKWTVDAGFGITYYPSGDDRLVENEGLDPDLDYNFPFGANLTLGVNAALTWWP